uniref:Uncharacterized protein n=1 Tax=Candidatus Nitrotoga fabula TaxID=2182327 RepID=A0A2X0SH43_9PROT|nr:protein of unknown function [Candidatus Nitrotoga fabula]
MDFWLPVRYSSSQALHFKFEFANQKITAMKSLINLELLMFVLISGSVYADLSNNPDHA